MKKYKGSYKGKDSYKEKIDLRVFKSHTEKRPISDWRITVKTSSSGHNEYQVNSLHRNPGLVQDIKRGLDNPLQLWPKQGDVLKSSDYWALKVHPPLIYKQQKGDRNEWHKDMRGVTSRHCIDCSDEVITEAPGEEILCPGCYLRRHEPKPNWLTRIKRKVKR